MNSVSGFPEFCKKELPLKIQGQDTDKILDIAWSPNGQCLAVATDGGKIQIFDVEKHKLKFNLPFKGSLIKITWSYDSLQLASIVESGVLLWDVRLGIQLSSVSVEQSGTVLCADWAPIKGGSLAYATADHNIHLWNLSG